jgi:SAM-dependent methyltransferase
MPPADSTFAAVPARSTGPDVAFDAGLLLRAGFDAVVASPRFARMEAFSEAFLAANRDTLATYARRWSADPFHHITRQWEYPFVAAQLERFAAAAGPPARVLDAGSGATFFPYFVAETYPGVSVDACDQDAMVTGTLDRIAHPAASRVTARVADLHGLPYEDGRFDVVYCISVLEHTRDYRAILEEFHRVLRPGGWLIGTFDVSVDDRTDIPRAGAADLLAALAERFTAVDAPGREAIALLDDPGTLTTGRMRATHGHLMPWRRSWRHVAASLLRGRSPRTPFYDLAVISGVYRRDLA